MKASLGAKWTWWQPDSVEVLETSRSSLERCCARISPCSFVAVHKMLAALLPRRILPTHSSAESRLCCSI
eukprot:2661641-Alexandrium_andersonii.AAC.1